MIDLKLRKDGWDVGFFVWKQIEGFSKDWQSIGIFNLWNIWLFRIFINLSYFRKFLLSLFPLFVVLRSRILKILRIIQRINLKMVNNNLQLKPLFFFYYKI